MKKHDKILAAYQTTNTAFELRKSAAWESKDWQLYKGFTHQQKLNEQAYFILFWAHIEARINENCAQRHQGKNVDHRSFKSRVEIALARETAGIRQILYECYDLRNCIAHGESLPSRIDLNEKFAELYQIVQVL